MLETVRARLEGLFWQYSQLWRRPARRLKVELSILRYHWLAARKDLPPRLVATDPKRGAPSRGTPPGAIQAKSSHLATQGVVPPTTEEALRMAAAAEGLEIVIAGALEVRNAGTAQSGDDATREDHILPLPKGAARLLRPASPGAAPPLVGRLVPLIDHEGGDGELTPLPLRRAGALLLRPDIIGPRLIRRPVYEVDRVLADVAAVDVDGTGATSTLFLLPFLAVGGAERLLFYLLEDLAKDKTRRLLVVTLDPHQTHLGTTAARCRQLTPFLFTLGDSMPREATWSALRHLIRRFRVETLFSWNGTVDFYDRVHELRRIFPKLRILHQLYHDRGGWTARTTPRVIRSVDRHIAVNRAIVTALEKRGAAKKTIRLIHHGVAIPPPVDSTEKKTERERRRRELGLPRDAVVVGTFIRLHAQKRPLDILELARRFENRDSTGEPVHFLLAGGGPLDDAIDRELAERPVSNLVRLPMTREPLPLYDAIDICLMTSSYEGLPVFLLDGLARSLPGVAPAVGDIPLLFASGGGLNVDRPGDLDGLEAAIRTLCDPDERRRRGRLARETVESEFSLDRYRDAYRSALEELDDEREGAIR